MITGRGYTLNDRFCPGPTAFFSQAGKRPRQISLYSDMELSNSVTQRLPLHISNKKKYALQVPPHDCIATREKLEVNQKRVLEKIYKK